MHHASGVIKFDLLFIYVGTHIRVNVFRFSEWLSMKLPGALIDGNILKPLLQANSNQVGEI